MCRVYVSENMVNNYQRRFVIDHANFRSWDVAATWHNVRGLFGEMDDPVNPYPYSPVQRDHILHQINSLQYCPHYDLDDLIPDPYDAIYIQLFDFFRMYGVPHFFPGVEGADPYDSPYEVADFPNEGLAFQDDTTISDQDEDWLVEMSSLSTQ